MNVWCTSGIVVTVQSLRSARAFTMAGIRVDWDRQAHLHNGRIWVGLVVRDITLHTHEGTDLAFGCDDAHLTLGYFPRLSRHGVPWAAWGGLPLLASVQDYVVACQSADASWFQALPGSAVGLEREDAWNGNFAWVHFRPTSPAYIHYWRVVNRLVQATRQTTGHRTMGSRQPHLSLFKGMHSLCPSSQ